MNILYKKSLNIRYKGKGLRYVNLIYIFVDLIK